MFALNYISNWADVVNHTLSCYPNEMCGIVLQDNTFLPFENAAQEPRHQFEMDGNILLQNDVKCVLHSHTYDPGKHLTDDPRIPSKLDLQGQVNTDVEWALVVCEGENVTQPYFWGDHGHRPPLMERDFIHSIQDCLGFVADWLYKDFDIKLPMMPRDFDWTEKGLDLFSENYTSWGFIDADHLPEQRGDVLLYKIRTAVVNHIGVVVQPNLVAQHLFSRMPIIEPADKWHKYITKRIRHISQVTR